MPDETAPWRYDWLLQDAGGQVQAQGEAEEKDAIEQVLRQNDLDNVRLTGLLPAENVLWCTAVLPGKQSRYLRQALPFAVEEQLAQDVESVHLALGNRYEDAYSVAAIDEPLMADTVARLSQWSADLHAVYADAALLPVDNGRWTFCIEGSDTLIAGAGGEWCRLQTQNLPVYVETLEAASGDDETLPVLRIYVTPAAREAHSLVIAALEQSERFSVIVEDLAASPLELLAHAHHLRLCQPINLSQGPFATDSGTQSPWRAWRAWRAVAVVAGIWFVLQVGLEIGQGIYFERDAQHWQQQALSTYKSIFPRESRVTGQNMKRVLEGKLRLASQQGSNLGFLPLLKQAGYQYSVIPDKGNLEFDSVNYSQDRGELVIEMKADNFDKLNQLKNGLTSAGLEARIGSVVNDKNSARGRITITGG